MAYQWMQSFKAENQRKTILLLILFPLFLLLIFWVVLSIFFTETGSWQEWRELTLQISPIVIAVLFIWWIVSFFLQKDIMFWLSWAKPITRKENPKIYNIVENLCISKWLPIPKIAIINEPWMNAFATWWRQQDSWIAFTSWLLEKLDKSEIEAVAGHELTHLINKDSLLMYVAFVFIGIVTVVGQFILRTWWSWKSSKKAWWIMALWIAFRLLWYLFYPLIRLAISRKREYMADLWSVELTRDSQSMISALRKISNHSYINANNSISWFFIAEPKRQSDINRKKIDMNVDNDWTKKIKTSIRDSHPSIDDRIEKLKNY